MAAPSPAALARGVRLYPWYQAAINGYFWAPVGVLYLLSRLPLADVMRLEALFQLAVVALEVPAGYLADRLGGRLALVAGALARGDETQVRRDTRMGLWLSAAYGVLIYPVFWWAEPPTLIAPRTRLAQVKHDLSLFENAVGCGINAVRQCSANSSVDSFSPVRKQMFSKGTPLRIKWL